MISRMIPHSVKHRRRQNQLAFHFVDEAPQAFPPARGPECDEVYLAVVYLRSRGSRVYRAGVATHLIDGKVRSTFYLKRLAL